MTLFLKRQCDRTPGGGGGGGAALVPLAGARLDQGRARADARERRAGQRRLGLGLLVRRRGCLPIFFLQHVY